MTLTWQSDQTMRSRRLVDTGFGSMAERVDPYLVWAATSGALPRDGWTPLLVQLGGMDAETFARRAGGEWSGAVRVAHWYEQTAPGLGATRFVCAWASRSFFGQVSDAGTGLARAVERFEYGLAGGPVPAVHGPHLPDAPFGPLGTSSVAPTPSWGSVVVGIVDDGIAFAHARLRGADGRPRVRHFWDQRTPVDAPAFVPALPVPYGVEWTADNAQPNEGAVDSLSDLVQAHTHAGQLDEDAVYAAAGQAQVAARARHGTHVLDLAAGAEPSSSAGPPVVAVQLPHAVGSDPSGHLLAPLLYDGLRYVVDRADRIAMADGLGGPVPVVVNLSYGLYGGPHDGSSMLEEAIDDLFAQREVMAGAPLSVVVAAGNIALARCHASFELGPSKRSRLLNWRIPPDSGAPAFLELWLGHARPDEPPAVVRVRLVPPVRTSNVAPAVGAGGYAELLDDTWAPEPGANDAIVATVSYVAAVSPANLPSLYGDRDMVLIVVWPTTGLDDARAWAPSGVWSVEVTHESGQSTEIHGWIRRNDTPFGFRARGRQSRFEDAGDPILDDGGRPIESDADDDPAGPHPIRRRATLNGIATGRSTVVVGAHRIDGALPAPYTSRGPAITQAASDTPHRSGPDLDAPSDGSFARPGVLAAGTRGRSVVGLNGTSVAAPAVVRRLAEAFRQGAKTTADALASISSPHPAELMGEADRTGTHRLDDPRDGLRVPRAERFP
jgi:hypothetical protein